MRLSLAALLIGLPLGAQSAKEQQRFAGVWEAKFKDAVICTIKLEAGEKLTGATYGCNIQVNEEGDLIESQPSENPDQPDPIVSASINGDKLAFTTEDAGDELKCELALTGDNRAELRFIGAPVKIKPIHFNRR